MGTMTIRHVDDHLKQRLRARAATHGRSMEDEVRDILLVALAADENQSRRPTRPDHADLRLLMAALTTSSAVVIRTERDER